MQITKIAMTCAGVKIRIEKTGDLFKVYSNKHGVAGIFSTTNADDCIEHLIKQINIQNFDMNYQIAKIRKAVLLMTDD